MMLLEFDIWVEFVLIESNKLINLISRLLLRNPRLITCLYWKLSNELQRDHKLSFDRDFIFFKFFFQDSEVDF